MGRLMAQSRPNANRKEHTKTPTKVSIAERGVEWTGRWRDANVAKAIGSANSSTGKSSRAKGRNTRQRRNLAKTETNYWGVWAGPFIYSVTASLWIGF